MVMMLYVNGQICVGAVEHYHRRRGDTVSRHSPGCPWSPVPDDDAVAQIRGPGTASKYIDTQPGDTGDKLVSAASDASDEAGGIESCDQTVWAAGRPTPLSRVMLT